MLFASGRHVYRMLLMSNVIENCPACTNISDGRQQEEATGGLCLVLLHLVGESR